MLRYNIVHYDISVERNQRQLIFVEYAYNMVPDDVTKV